MDELKKFLIEAKKQTYANSNSEKLVSSRVKSNDYEYSNGKYMYHDTYFGGLKFMGEEVVYLDNEPIWGMNYYGITLDTTMSEEAMDKALRPALMEVGKTDILPVRGPLEYKNGDYKYQFKVKGEIDNFTGEEIVTYKEKEIYKLKCHGGLIK